MIRAIYLRPDVCGGDRRTSDHGRYLDWAVRQVASDRPTQIERAMALTGMVECGPGQTAWPSTCGCLSG
jgi:hypothetical protein